MEVNSKPPRFNDVSAADTELVLASGGCMQFNEVNDDDEPVIKPKVSKKPINYIPYNGSWYKSDWDDLDAPMLVRHPDTLKSGDLLWVISRSTSKETLVRIEGEVKVLRDGDHVYEWGWPSRSLVKTTRATQPSAEEVDIDEIEEGRYLLDSGNPKM